MKIILPEQRRWNGVVYGAADEQICQARGAAAGECHPGKRKVARRGRDVEDAGILLGIDGDAPRQAGGIDGEAVDVGDLHFALQE